jgi:protease YdgD
VRFFFAFISILFACTHISQASDHAPLPTPSQLEDASQPRKYKEPLKEQLRGVKGKDDRALIEKYNYPWSAIGRINKESGGFCTGTLIAPNLVLTAAHCVWNKKRQKWENPDSIHFLAGYHRGSFIDHSVGTKFFISPTYQPKNGQNLKIAARDWVIIVLKKDLSKEIGTIAVAPVDKTSFNELMDKHTTFIQAGYSQDKAHILSVNKVCPMKSYNKMLNVVVHTCDAVHGDSGSPIFYTENGLSKIAYIHVATTKQGESEGIAVSGISIANHLKEIGLWDMVQVSRKPNPS